MPDLVMYGVLNASGNGLAGNLIKAKCKFCGRKYGSIEEAEKCERNCFAEVIYKCLNQKK